MPTRDELEKLVEKKRARESLENAVLMKRQESEGMPKDEDKPYTMPESIEAFGKSAADMATMGYLPQIQAGVSQLTKGGAPSVKDYISERDTAIDELAQLKKRQPLASTLGAGTGLVGGALATGGIGAAAKGASMAQKLYQAAKVGGLQGLLANPGDTKGEIGLQTEERLKNAAIAAPLSALGQGVAEKLPGLVKSGANKLKEESEELAYGALRPKKRHVSQDNDKDLINKIGKTLLDKNIIKKIPASKTVLKERVEDAAKESGKGLEVILDRLAQKESEFFGKVSKDSKTVLVPGTKLPSGGIDKNLMSEALERELISDLDLPLSGVKAEAEKFKGMIDDFNDGKPMTIKEAQDWKKKLQKRIKWDRLPGADIPDEEKFYRALLDKIKTGVEDSAEFFSKQTGDFQDYKNAKKSYQTLKAADRILEDSIASETANRVISPSDYGTGAAAAVAAAASGNPTVLTGLGVGALNRAARLYGGQVAAKGAEAMSGKMSGLAEKLSKFPPGSLPQGLERLRESMAKENKGSDRKSDLISEIRKNPALINVIKDRKLREMILKEMETN